MATIGLQLFGSVAGIFGAHHAAAVKNEAQGMNQAIPLVRQSFDSIVTQVNEGTLTVDQANAYLDAIWPQYESLVYDQFKIKKKDCNGPCVYEKQLKQDAANIKALLSSGRAGTVTISGISPGRGYQTFPAYQLSYNGPAGIVQSLESMLGLGSITGSANSGVLGGSAITVGNVKVPMIVLLVALASLGFALYAKK